MNNTEPENKDFKILKVFIFLDRFWGFIKYYSVYFLICSFLPVAFSFWYYQYNVVDNEINVDQEHFVEQKQKEYKEKLIESLSPAEKITYNQVTNVWNRQWETFFLGQQILQVIMSGIVFLLVCRWMHKQLILITFLMLILISSQALAEWTGINQKGNLYEIFWIGAVITIFIFITKHIYTLIHGTGNENGSKNYP